jgi:hypothetical protein
VDRTSAAAATEPVGSGATDGQAEATGTSAWCWASRASQSRTASEGRRAGWKRGRLDSRSKASRVSARDPEPKAKCARDGPFSRLLRARRPSTRLGGLPRDRPGRWPWWWCARWGWCRWAGIAGLGLRRIAGSESGSGPASAGVDVVSSTSGESDMGLAMGSCRLREGDRCRRAAARAGRWARGRGAQAAQSGNCRFQGARAGSPARAPPSASACPGRSSLITPHRSSPRLAPSPSQLPFCLPPLLLGMAFRQEAASLLVSLARPTAAAASASTSSSRTRRPASRTSSLRPT